MPNLLLIGLNACLAICIFILVRKAVFGFHINNSRVINELKNVMASEKSFNYSHLSHGINGIEVELDFLDKFHLKYIERTRINDTLPFANAYNLMLLIVVIFISCFIFILSSGINVVADIIISLVISFIPLGLLKVRTKHISEKVRTEVYEYVKALHSYSLIRNDLTFMFTKIADDNLRMRNFYDEKKILKPRNILMDHTERMVEQIRNGLDPEVALEIFRLKVNNAYFNSVILTISEAYKAHGNLNDLMINLTREAYRLNKALYDRKYKTLVNRSVVAAYSVLVIGIIVFTLILDTETANVFKETFAGQIVLSLSLLFYVISLPLAFMVTDFDY